jgi:hypothetical protein
MSKKNKHKPQPLKQPFQPKTNEPVKPTLTEDQKLEIEVKQEELQSVEPVDQFSPESESKLKESEAKEDLSRYWNYVKEINKRLESSMNSTKDEKDKTTKLKDELEASKKETEGIKADLKKKREEYNKRDKEITEREFALDNGEYTTIISRLLETIKDTEKKVFTDTENLLKELSDFHKKNLEDFSNQISQSADVDKQLAMLKREKKRFEVEKQIFKEDLQDDFETKYAEQLTLKTAESERLKRKKASLEQENAKLKQVFEDLRSAFGTEEITAEFLLKEHSKLKEILSKKTNELNNRPYLSDLQSKQSEIDWLKKEIEVAKSKFDEDEFNKLKLKFGKQDEYIVQSTLLKEKIESLEAKEIAYKGIIKTQKETIKQFVDAKASNDNAFEFAKKCDVDSRNLGFNHLQQKKDLPKDLAELSAYVQQWMAFKSDKPFYYSLETIRIFLAGLHMSPISILQGISGTGKTSLPREFAKALVSDGCYVGVDDENQNKAPYRICAVQSGWRDNMDLMGYYNSFEHKYKETDFFKALYVANQPKYSDTLFLIILDEMNLSRPEHYFADFLSLLEQSPSERFITLSNTPNEVLPVLVKGSKLRIPENVRFIGTANHDETTLEFAPKTYDRSNLMEMPKNHPDKKDFKPIDVSFNVKYSWLNAKFEEAEIKHKESYNKFHSFINADDMKLLLMDKGIGIGNRLEFQAEKFISAYVESGKEKEKDVAKAVDHLITSRLFRTLKNRYDLDKANLTKFKDDYNKLFHTFFKSQPSFAIELLSSEINKK